MPMVRMHAAAPQLDHPVAQRAQAHQVEFGVGVETADAPRLRGGQHAIGADHLRRVVVAHDQVFAILVVEIHVVSGNRTPQAGAHFAGEHAVAQALGFADFVVVARPADGEAGAWRPGRDGGERRPDGCAQQDGCGLLVHHLLLW